ncbi:MAG TPA: thioredoxin family protein [Candidatus Limnocylindrales bacterium]|jgi:small redox-active disulfide protein 2|nr:thioredoxin family protein [Candidatus Limnocylindrales bacterium]
MKTTIEVLGPGCFNCRRLEQAARDAVAIAGVDADIRHVTDDAEIARRGVMRTPGLVIDGTVVSYGRVPGPREIAEWLPRP